MLEHLSASAEAAAPELKAALCLLQQHVGKPAVSSSDDATEAAESAFRKASSA